jgi:microsomal dipeptidase-like Zn-dependent dipeptidase
MILPNKVIKPIDSLLTIGAYVLNIVEKNDSTIDEIVKQINKIYPKKISIEKVLLCLDFLYATGKIELNNHKVKTI